MSTASFIPPLPAARPLRVAIIGAGVMGKRHARVMASQPTRFDLAVIMDVDGAAAAEVAREHGARAATREDDALDDVEAVVVATPIAAHAATVKRALARGVNVLVEKPIAESAQVATELLASAEQHHRRVFVGHSERFNPVVRALARLVDPSALGSIAFRRAGVRSTRAHGAEHGALVNLGVHDLDLAAYFARSPLVGERAIGQLTERGVDVRADVFARTASGVPIHVFVDQDAAPDGRARTVALATASHLWLGDMLALSLVRACRETGARETIPLDTEEPLLAQALAFAAAVRGGPATEIATGADGAHALHAAERARAQLHAAAPPGEKLSASRLRC